MTVATPMDAKALTPVVQALLAARRAEAPRLNEVYAYLHDQVVDIYVPKRATAEYSMLVDQSRFNITNLLVSSVANNLFIDGYRPAKQAENADVWNTVWQPNRMDARQAGIWRSSLSYGHSFVRVLPGKLAKKPAPVLTPFSPRKCTALYEDPINDEWARYVLVVGNRRPEFADGAVSYVVDIKVYDENFEYAATLPAGMADTAAYRTPTIDLATFAGLQFDPAKVKVREHGLDYAPFVRYVESFGDLDDGPTGVVYPMLPAQRQLQQTTFGLLMAQQYAAFKQRWVTGMGLDEDENGVAQQPFNPAVDTMFSAEDIDTKFGEFGQTDLGGYLTSRDKTLLYISSVRQIAPHTMVVGDAVSNISAEALTALEAGHRQDIAEHQTCYGEGNEQLMRLAGLAMGDRAAWNDTSAQTRWRDTVPRSLAQIADAFGKLATMLQVPPEELWEKLPDVTDQDLERWKATKKKNDAERDTFAKLGQVMAGAQSRGQRANPAAPAGAGAGGSRGGAGRPADS